MTSPSDPSKPGDWPAVRRTYVEGIGTGYATFETEVPPRKSLEAKWLPDHSWAAEIDGEVAGWAAVTPCRTDTATPELPKHQSTSATDSADLVSEKPCCTSKSPSPTPSSSNAAAPATTSDERTVTRVRGGGSVKGSR